MRSATRVLTAPSFSQRSWHLLRLQRPAGMLAAPVPASADTTEMSIDDYTGEPKKKRRSRQNFTWGQLSVLERVFETDPLPRQALLQELSNRLDITPRCVQVWFQNRRQKFKAMHQAMGQAPPSLRKSSSYATSLEKLLPDLAPAPSHAASTQLHETPSSLQMPSPHMQAYAANIGPPVGMEPAVPQIAGTSVPAPVSAPGAASSAAQLPMWPSTNESTPVSVDAMHMVRYVGMQGKHPIFEMRPPADAIAAACGRHFVQAANGVVMHIALDGTASCTYVPHVVLPQAAASAGAMPAPYVAPLARWPDVVPQAVPHATAPTQHDAADALAMLTGAAEAQCRSTT